MYKCKKSIDGAQNYDESEGHHDEQNREELAAYAAIIRKSCRTGPWVDDPKLNTIHCKRVTADARQSNSSSL